MTGPSELQSRLQAALDPEYRIEGELGHGGMGVVFLARDTTLDRAVAVKVVHPDLAVHRSITERFLAEARMIAKLRHPNIVAVHSAGETTGLFYYVMDYVPGESLRQRLSRESPLPSAEVTRIVLDLADALHAAGQAGVVHRDVKPENVLLDSGTGRAMLADFGIARAMAAEATGGLTGQGVAVGTPTYMSPEQAAGETVDHRSDLYALGVLGYEMLTGRPPFRAPNATAIASMHLAEKPTPVSTLRPEAPAPLAGALMRALEKSPASRWQTGADFRQGILGTIPTPTSIAPPRRRRWMAAAVTVALVTVASVALALRPGSPPPGVNPRHSILVLPFDNLRGDPGLAWLRDGSVNMLALNLSQWNDLTAVDHERLHDLLDRRKLRPSDPIGLEMARQLARDAGVWTVVLGDYAESSDSLHLVARMYDVASGRRIDVAQVGGPVAEDVRPLFDQLAARLLDLSGAPTGVRTDLARATTSSVEAFRSYLQGLEHLNAWSLGDAERDLTRAARIDTTFALAYYKLALTRGWASGANDSIGQVAIRRATQYAARVPEHDRTMINAYRAFTDGDFGSSRSAYQGLVARDSTDADAWYGLGDVWFHDTTAATHLGHHNHNEAYRAFKRAISLAPDYYLAYEHLQWLLNSASSAEPGMVLLASDSFAPVYDSKGRKLLDSTTITGGIQRARGAGIVTARNWLASQPDNPHAQAALIEAYAAGENYGAAIAEVDRLRTSSTGRGRPDLPFLRARLMLEGGDFAGADHMVGQALDSVRPEDFLRYSEGVLPIETVGTLSSGANVLAYHGKVREAKLVIDLASRTQATWYGSSPGARKVGGTTAWGARMLGQLFTSVGAPTSAMRSTWSDISDAAKAATKADRKQVMEGAWPAALGLFLSEESDSAALHEFSGVMGEPWPPELLALQAIAKKDTVTARQILAKEGREPTMGDPDYKSRSSWWGYRAPLLAQAHYLLGDYQVAIKLLEGFQPDHFSTRGFDGRWGLLGRVRLLRGAAYEGLGRKQEAGAEYKQALEQWSDADPALQEFIREAEKGMARVSGIG